MSLDPNVRPVCTALLCGAISLGLLFIALKGLEYSHEYREHLIPGVDFAFEGSRADGVQLFFVSISLPPPCMPFTC